MLTNMYALERMARELPEERLREVETYRRLRRAKRQTTQASLPTADGGRAESLVARALSRLLPARALRLQRG